MNVLHYFVCRVAPQCCNLKVFARKTERMIYPEAAQLKLQFEFWILCRSLAELCTEYYFLHIKTYAAQHIGKARKYFSGILWAELLFQNKHRDLCQNQWTRTANLLVSPVSVPPPPSHLLTNLIIFPRTASHFLSLWRNCKAQGREGWKTANQSSQF